VVPTAKKNVATLPESGKGSVKKPIPAHTRVRRQSAAILKSVDLLLKNNLPESAIDILCALLKLDSGFVPALHKIGHCLDKLDRCEEAILCYRGVLPEQIDAQYFQAALLQDEFYDAQKCTDVEYLTAYTEEKLALQSPVRNDTDKPYGQFNYPTTHARETFCTVAQQGAIWFDGYNTIAFDCNNKVICEHNKGNEYAAYHSSKVTEVTELKGTACFLDARSSAIYYHWMLDVLPKLGILEKVGIELEAIDHFVVQAKSNYQYASLLSCGVPRQKIVSVDGPQYFHADSMLVPSLRNDLGEKVYTGLGLGLGTWIPVFLQSRMIKQTEAQALYKKYGSKIYVSRSTRGSRNVHNEPQLIESLKSRGFSVVEFENHSVSEQAGLMSMADVVIAVHGAGLTNVSYCKPGTLICEIFGDYVVPCYWSLCGVAKLDYSQFMASSVESDIDVIEPGQKIQHLRDKEIQLDVEELTAYLDTLLDAR